MPDKVGVMSDTVQRYFELCQIPYKKSAELCQIPYKNFGEVMSGMVQKSQEEASKLELSRFDDPLFLSSRVSP